MNKNKWMWLKKSNKSCNKKCHEFQMFIWAYSVFSFLIENLHVQAPNLIDHVRIDLMERTSQVAQVV